MSTDYSKMSDFEINLRVAEIVVDYDCISRLPYTDMAVHWGDGANWHVFNPCNNPEDAWPIIVRNKISIVSLDNKWIAAPTDTVIDGITGDSEVCFYASSDAVFDVNPLRAAMIVFLMMQQYKNAS